MGAVADAAAIGALLASAREEFARRLPARIAEISDLIGQDAWSDAVRAAHKLRGSASTYGFSELGGVAVTLEEELRAIKGTADEATRKRLVSLLEEGRDHAERACKSER
jgi:HPt (histidine-containing phosphotransfer) domain-containing protein